MFVLKDASTDGLYSFQFHYGIEIVRFGFISRSYLFLELTSTEEQGWRFLLKETTGTLIGLILAPDRHPGFKLQWLLKKKIGLHSYFNLPTYYLNPTESEIRIIGYVLFRMATFLRCSFFPMWIIYLIFCQGFNMTWWYHMNMSDVGRL